MILEHAHFGTLDDRCERTDRLTLNSLCFRRSLLATSLSPSQYSQISVLLPANLVTGSLLAILEPALNQGGTFEVQGEAAQSEDILGELRLVGLTGANKTESGIVSRPRRSRTIRQACTDSLFCRSSQPNLPLHLPPLFPSSDQRPKSSPRQQLLSHQHLVVPFPCRHGHPALRKRRYGLSPLPQPPQALSPPRSTSRRF